MKKATPWSYHKGSSALHRMSAGIKLLFLLLLSLAAFIPVPEAYSFSILGSIALILAVLSFIAKSNPIALLRGSRPLFLVILSVFLFRGLEFSPHGLNTDGLKETLTFGARIGIAFASGSLFFSVTTSGQTRKSLSKLETFLRLEKIKLSLSVSLMLSFLPRFFESWEELNLAWKSRGGKGKLSRLVILVSLIIEKMMEKAAETAKAMEARGMSL